MTRVLVGAALVALLAAAGCGELVRKDYDAVALGQTADQVKRSMGAPRYQSDTEWTYTSDDPRDWMKATVRFGPDGKVIGKSWQSPEKPWENSREGQAP